MSDAALRSGCDIDNSIAYDPQYPNPLFNMVRENSLCISSQEMMNTLRYLCNIGYDIEERNAEGLTLILYEAKQLFPSVISVLKLLIEKGADLCTVDPYNRGALHFALMVPNKWGAWSSPCTDACHHLGYDHDYFATFQFRTESKGYAEDYCNYGLTPAPSTIDDIQSDHLAYDDGVQERLCRTCVAKLLLTTDSTRSGFGSHSSRGRSGQYIDLDETDDDDEDEEIDVGDEDEERANGGDNSGEEEDKTDEDNNAEDLKIPKGYVLCYDKDGSARIIRDPLSILKTRLRFKLLTLLRAGCDPNVLDNKGNSPSDDAKYHGLWPEWTWALLNAGYVFDENSDRWVKRLEEEVSLG